MMASLSLATRNECQNVSPHLKCETVFGLICPRRWQAGIMSQSWGRIRHSGGGGCLPPFVPLSTGCPARWALQISARQDNGPSA